ncbi:hypothetical protein, partial [Colwellia sp. BRX10-6]|uniref:hypothetical protein n=1 Tax=Colwellia sp. BRX10-6 TaxID=2759841 RepID=UPI001C7152EA
CHLTDKTLTLTFSKPSRERLLHIEDVGGSGGIVLDMPEIQFADIAGQCDPFCYNQLFQLFLHVILDHVL